jgi:isocitrate/isopropylmalate dehydrogenase
VAAVLGGVVMMLANMLQWAAIFGGGRSDEEGGSNPLAAIASAQMMLETLGEDKGASRIERGIVKVLQNDIKSLAAGRMGLSTNQVGDKVAEYASS